MAGITIQSLVAKVFDYLPTRWYDKVVDPEGHNSQRGTKFEAKKANNIEQGVDLAHDRLNEVVDYLEGNEVTTKNLRFEFLLMKASITSGLTSNILVDDFSTTDSIILSEGRLNAAQQRIEIL